jgi:hypothetical protein
MSLYTITYSGAQFTDSIANAVEIRLSEYRDITNCFKYRREIEMFNIYIRQLIDLIEIGR